VDRRVAEDKGIAQHCIPFHGKPAKTLLDRLATKKIKNQYSMSPDLGTSAF